MAKKGNEKEKRKRNNTLFLVVLILLLCISIGYAIFRQAYSLKGTANVIGHNWALDTKQDDIVSRLNGSYIYEGQSGYATVSTVDGNIEVSYDIDLKTMGDVYTVDFPIDNAGVIDVVLNSIDTTGFTPHKAYLKYEVVRVDGNTETPLENGFVLRKNERLNVRIRITYRNDDEKDITQFPSGGQTYTASLLTKLGFGQYIES